MSTSAITSDLLSTDFDTSSTANQFATDLNQLAQDLQQGNLSAAQQDFVTLSQDLQDGTTSSSATTSSSGITVSLLSGIGDSSSSLSAFTGELNQLGTDLESGNLSGAQKDLLSLDSTAFNASSPGNNAASTSSSVAATTPSERSNLIHAIIQALSVGDTSAASTGLLQLASVSTSSQGASALEKLSGSIGSSSSLSTGSLGNLLQSVNGTSSSADESLLE